MTWGVARTPFFEKSLIARPSPCYDVQQMSGEDVDDDLERQLHHGFTGRQELFGELGHQLLENGVDRCVALIGGSGTGKSAAATSWVAHRRAGHELVFGHFTRT